MRYKAITEQKVASDQATDIKESMFALQIIVILKEENDHYIILINNLNKLLI